MANLPAVAGHNTLIDIAKSFDPQGKVAVVAELLNQSNELIQYMNFIEGNLPTGHKAVVRAGLPTVTLRRFYKGVAPSKSGRDTIEDVLAMQEGRNEIDKDLADLNGNANAFRMSESLAFIESMNQTFAQQIMYGNTATNKDGILGFTPRYNAISGATNGQNVLSAGGTGNSCTSVWLTVWGENTVTGIYPKGSKAGLMQEDLGVIDAFDASNNRFRAYAELWQWKFGLHVKDWRYVVRIPNILVSDLLASTGTQAPGTPGVVDADLAAQPDDEELRAYPFDGYGRGDLPRQPHGEGDAVGGRGAEDRLRSDHAGGRQPVRQAGAGLCSRYGHGHQGRTAEVLRRADPDRRPDPADRSRDHLGAGNRLHNFLSRGAMRAPGSETTYGHA